MLMNAMAVGCFLIVAGVMAAMWKFDRNNEGSSSRQENETRANGNGSSKGNRKGR